MSKTTAYHGTITKAELFARVRRFCKWCCGGSNKEIENCTSYECQWWDIRLGNKKPLDRPERPPHEQSWRMPETK